ncbi:Fic family protein [Photorhabdus bodei]|uniref:Fic family protein n=1 Tax=Photorhabdus bodei TaxID=2029681 RepID=A0AAW6BP26_9GAMM|nr:Fic family protein [Photorhabdus bodei]MCC8465913.1 Fic family protein [Photorhabdus bodei]MDB6374888.1 Fic family protein [Photorhabdus bodei]
MWIWEQPNWPEFHWNVNTIAPLLRDVHFNQGLLLGKSDYEDTKQATLDSLLSSILYSSEIEGERLNAASIHSSLANRLGITEEKPYPIVEKSDGITKVALDVIENSHSDLTLERILKWHQLIFPEGYTMFNPIQGGKLRERMIEVVSGRLDKPTVHIEAPPPEKMVDEVPQFITWFNQSRTDTRLDPIIRAAIVHLWFVTIHPLEDGNGRITRFLTDLALAQAENRSIRFYAMSVSICHHCKAYYEILENTQHGGLDITDWLVWFLKILNETLTNKLKEINQVVQKAKFWRRIDQTQLTAEQTKVLNRMLDGNFEQGISNSQYQKVAKVSRATTTRHLAHLVELNCLESTEAGGRSTRYLINHEY